MKILVVDDSIVSRLLITQILSEVALCDHAVNVEEAVTAYNHAIQTGRPYDLILLDIQLENKKEGLTLLKMIREHEEKHGCLPDEGVPIIILTAHEDHFIEAYQYGCNDYLLKPIQPDALLNAVQKFTV